MTEMMCLKEKLTSPDSQEKMCSKGYIKDMQELEKSKRRAKGVSCQHQKSSDIKTADESFQISRDKLQK